MQRLNASDRRQHAEGTIILAGIANGIDMRAEQERRQVWAPPLITPDHIADRIDPSGHAGLVHPGGNQFAGLSKGRREVEAGEFARLIGERCELTKALVKHMAEGWRNVHAHALALFAKAPHFKRFSDDALPWRRIMSFSLSVGRLVLDRARAACSTTS